MPQTKTKFEFHHMKSFENIIPSLSPHAMLGETRISTRIWAEIQSIPSKSCQQRHVPGLPIRDYTECCNNLSPGSVKLSATNMIVNAICERLYLFLCWRSSSLNCHHALFAHFPTALSAAISRFKRPLIFFPSESRTHTI